MLEVLSEAYNAITDKLWNSLEQSSPQKPSSPSGETSSKVAEVAIPLDLHTETAVGSPSLTGRKITPADPQEDDDFEFIFGDDKPQAQTSEAAVQAEPSASGVTRKKVSKESYVKELSSCSCYRSKWSIADAVSALQTITGDSIIVIVNNPNEDTKDEYSFILIRKCCSQSVFHYPKDLLGVDDHGWFLNEAGEKGTPYPKIMDLLQVEFLKFTYRLLDDKTVVKFKRKGAKNAKRS